MNRLQHIGLLLVRRARRFCRLPQTFALVLKKRRRQAVLNELEMERLDRICNPSKYLGK